MNMESFEMNPQARRISFSSTTFSRLALALLAGLAAPAFAFQPLITDDTGTQGSAGNQIEFAYTRDRAETSGDTVRTTTLPFVFTRGLSDTLDVFAGLSHTRIRAGGSADASGFANPSFGAKWRFYEDEDSGTSLGIKPEVSLPVSASRERDGLGTGKLSGNLSLILSQELPFGALHVNAVVGRERYRDGAGTPNATINRFSLAPVWNVSEQWKLALDLGVESVREAGDRTRTGFVEFGAIYSPSEDLDLALGLIRALDDADPRTTTNTATAGVTWRFR